MIKQNEIYESFVIDYLNDPEKFSIFEYDYNTEEATFLLSIYNHYLLKKNKNGRTSKRKLKLYEVIINIQADYITFLKNYKKDGDDIIID